MKSATDGLNWRIFLHDQEQSRGMKTSMDHLPAPVRLIASRLRTFLMLRSSIITRLCGGGWITDAPVTGVAPS